MTRVLLAEDDIAISEPLARALRREGYEVLVREDGPAALETGLEEDIDLLVLDLGLPEMDGLEVCRRLRADGKGFPVLVLTARADEVDTVVGLDAGADDYVTKPFRLAELLARVRALLRRGTVDLTTGAHGVKIDVESHRAWLGEEELQLSAKEFELLRVLLENAGRLVTKGRLLRAVWGTAYQDEASYVYVHVSQLRRKLAAADPEGRLRDLIATEPGVGYRVSAPSDDSKP